MDQLVARAGVVVELHAGDGQLAFPELQRTACKHNAQQRDGCMAAIEQGTPESRWVDHQLGHPVIETFDNTYAGA